MNQRSYTITEEELKIAYDDGLTLHETAAKFNMTPVTIWRKAKKIDIAWKDNPNITVNNKGKSISLESILAGDHPQYQTFKLKNKLLKDGIKENKCEICGLTEWNNKPLNMQLDHIDGNSHNHVLDNLRMICPNCHSQSETYCGKNK
jgi:hypothetical protein